MCMQQAAGRGRGGQGLIVSGWGRLCFPLPSPTRPHAGELGSHQLGSPGEAALGDRSVLDQRVLLQSRCAFWPVSLSSRLF